ncbi:MAG: redoxin family protein [Fimbriimonadales bacterium]
MILLIAALAVGSAFPFGSLLGPNGKGSADAFRGKQVLVLREPSGGLLDSLARLGEVRNFSLAPVYAIGGPNAYTATADMLKLFPEALLVNRKGRIVKRWETVAQGKFETHLGDWLEGSSVAIGHVVPDPRGLVAVLPKLKPASGWLQLIGNTLQLRFPPPTKAEKTLGLLVLFLSSSGPADELYLERIKLCAASAREAKLGVLALFSNYDETAVAVSTFAANAEVDFDIALDSGNAFADAYRATRTPEVFLMDADGKVAYTGAVDSSTWPAAENLPFLMRSIEAVSKGELPKIARSLPFGTVIRRSADDETR